MQLHVHLPCMSQCISLIYVEVTDHLTKTSKYYEPVEHLAAFRIQGMVLIMKETKHWTGYGRACV